MASSIAKVAAGGGGGTSFSDALASASGNDKLNLEGFTGTKTGLAGAVEQFKYSQAQNTAGQGVAQPGGIMDASMLALGNPMDNGSTAGIAPAPEVGMPADTSGTDQFAGKKFEISPVQMKGSFSSKARANAEGVYGSEEQRNNSLKR